MIREKKSAYNLNAYFTILEILAVMAIISVLASILLPAIAKTRAKAKYGRWLGYKNQLKGDEGLVFYHTFEGFGETTLSNLAIGDVLNSNSQVDAENSTIMGTIWLRNAGRWPDKHSLYFNGIDSRIVSTFSGIGGSRDRTFFAWIKTESKSDQVICSWGSVVTPGNAWWLRINNAGPGMKGALYLAVLGGRIIGNTPLWDGEWHHVAVVFANDGTPDVRDVLIYVDGRLDAQFGGDPAPSASGAITINTDIVSQSELFIGSSPFVSWPFKGQIDEIGVFDRALTATEIKNLYVMATP